MQALSKSVRHTMYPDRHVYACIAARQSMDCHGLVVADSPDQRSTPWKRTKESSNDSMDTAPERVSQELDSNDATTASSHAIETLDDVIANFVPRQGERKAFQTLYARAAHSSAPPSRDEPAGGVHDTDARKTHGSRETVQKNRQTSPSCS